MALVRGVTQNQIKILEYISKVSRGVPRQELLRNVIPNPASLHRAIRNLEPHYIRIEWKKASTRPTMLVFPTPLGRELLEVLNGLCRS